MALKHYICNASELHTTVEHDGRQYRIHFEPQSYGSLCVSTDPAEQEAIEHDPRFNSRFSLSHSEMELVEPEPLDFIIADQVTNISEAKEYLSALEVPYQGLRTPASILKKAEDLHISFPNLIL